MLWLRNTVLYRVCNRLHVFSRYTICTFINYEIFNHCKHMKCHLNNIYFHLNKTPCCVYTVQRTNNFIITGKMCIPKSVIQNPQYIGIFTVKKPFLYKRGRFYLFIFNFGLLRVRGRISDIPTETAAATIEPFNNTKNQQQFYNRNKLKPLSLLTTNSLCINGPCHEIGTFFFYFINNSIKHKFLFTILT
jgi:hypothetical protein